MEARLEQDEGSLVDRAREKPAEKRRIQRNQVDRIWFSMIPSHLNGNYLSAEEFRDNIRLGYNLDPLEMQMTCDGCGARMTVEHALSCKNGGLVHVRHDDMAEKTQPQQWPPQQL